MRVNLQRPKMFYFTRETAKILKIAIGAVEGVHDSDDWQEAYPEVRTAYALVVALCAEEMRFAL